MYKNQLQELAQRSCFNLPSYACVREGPDHAPRFKASVNFNGEIFEGPSNCTTMRQAEHAAAEVALTNLSTRGPARSLAARVLDETGVYKNLLQEAAHRAGLKLPSYTTVRSGPGHQPVFTCTVELAGMSFTGESAKTKKQAEKNVALVAWCALKQMPDLGSSSQSSKENESSEEQEKVLVTRVLSKFRPKEENRPMRQRIQQQQHRRRVKLEPREGQLTAAAASSSSLINSISYQQKWRSLDPLHNVYSSYPLQNHERCILAPFRPVGPKVLPPMPFVQQSAAAAAAAAQEPVASKDNYSSPLLGSMNKPMTVSVSGISQIKIHEVLPDQLEQKQKDSDGQLLEKSSEKDKTNDQESYIVKENFHSHKPLYARAFPLQTTIGSSDQTLDQHGLYPRTNALSSVAPVRRNSRLSIPRMLATGGFHAPGIAPAVHIRTVIPVCAPPPMKLVANDNGASKKEEGEVSAATWKLNKLQL